MNDMRIVRPRLNFEREFGQYKNWWVRDPRIAGNPISIYLYLLSHDIAYPVTQTEARIDLGLGERAWVSAKKALLECGFLVEVRDRFPDGHVGPDGRPRGRQRRFRLFLQDPEVGVQMALEDAVIELERPYEEWIEELNSLDPAKRRHGNRSDSALCRVEAKPQVSPTLHNADTDASTLHNAGSFIGREDQVGLVGSITSSNQPTNQTVSRREHDAQLDAELAALHPDLHITIEQVRREVSDRIDLEQVDVVAAVRDTVIRAAARGSRRIDNPASYVASVIVRQPGNWPVGAQQSIPFEAESVDPEPFASRPNCVDGVHWWGADSWAEHDRSHCVNCGEPRRNVEPAYAEFEEELIGGGS